MKRFDSEAFSRDIRKFISERLSGDVLVSMGISSEELLELESGNMSPDGNMCERICSLMGRSAESYFRDEDNIETVLIDMVPSEDREAIRLLIERIRIKEKYEELAARC